MITDLLMPGKANAIPRSELVTVSGLPDRQVREQLEQARMAGMLICNDQDGRGYYLAETREEAAAQFKRDYARALSLLARMKPFREALSVTDGQLSIEL